jgi:hypothetical protein
MRLNLAPFGMIAEVEGAEVVDRFADSVAGADDKNPCGFGVRSVRTNSGRRHIHRVFSGISRDVFSFFEGGKKAKNSSQPTDEALSGLAFRATW